jgi:hypothetical protein
LKKEVQKQSKKKAITGAPNPALTSPSPPERAASILSHLAAELHTASIAV